jgi:hypothetical protein
MTTEPIARVRIPALDFTKGALVLIMVFYHWLNYFVGITNVDYRFLLFLTPSFIFITGFLISNVYLSKYRASDPGVSKRLLTRGAKLLLIFVALNIAREILISKSFNGFVVTDQLNVNTLWAIFVVGDVPIATVKVVAFYILIPIAYVLILSAGLLSLYKHFRYTFHAFFAACLLCILGLSLRGLRSTNLELVAIGLLGVLVGFIPAHKINGLVKHPYLFILSYLAYVLAILAWNVPFVLLTVGVCLTLWGIYMVGLGNAGPGAVRRHIILLGRHSLFGYIVQIAILQILSLTLRHIDFRLGVIGLSFVAAFTLTMAAVEAVEYAMRKSMIAGLLYKGAFA